MDDDAALWSVTFEHEVPGWLLVPSDLDAQGREAWIAAATQRLRRDWAEEWGEGAAEAVRVELEAALDARASSGSFLVFQAWPVVGIATAMVHVNVLASDDLPDWTTIDAVVHGAEAPLVGPGLQCTTMRSVGEGDDRVTLASVHAILDDGDTTLMLSIDETLVSLVTRALPGFLLALGGIRMTRENGERFTSVPPSGILEDMPWDLEEGA